MSSIYKMAAIQSTVRRSHLPIPPPHRVLQAQNRTSHRSGKQPAGNLRLPLRILSPKVGQHGAERSRTAERDRARWLPLPSEQPRNVVCASGAIPCRRRQPTPRLNPKTHHATGHSPTAACGGRRDAQRAHRVRWRTRHASQRSTRRARSEDRAGLRRLGDGGVGFAPPLGDCLGGDVAARCVVDKGESAVTDRSDEPG